MIKMLYLSDEELIIIIGDNIIAVKIEQPRSYLNTEPAALRATMNNFDCYKQFNDRAMSLLMCGHPIDKIEIIVLGGTWDHYPLEYQFEYIRDIYYSANVFSEPVKRGRYSLAEEIEINENAKHRIIGLTIETRPDCITLKQIKKLRKMNVTRVQIGVQHIDNDVLKQLVKKDGFIGLSLYPYHLKNLGECTAKEFCSMVKELINPNLEFEFKEMPKDDPKQRKPSIELAKKILNWEPKIELKEGLIKTIEWFKCCLLYTSDAADE